MEALKLEEMVPQASSITIKSTGKTYALRPFTLADEIWLRQIFGEDLPKIFAEMRLAEICRIVFHQLTDEAKKDFLVQEVAFIDENGEELKKRIGGAELLSAMIVGGVEKVELVKSLLETFGISRPKLEAIEKAEEEKKRVEKEPTGPSSLMP